MTRRNVPDYGLDAPGVVRNLSLIAAAGILLAVLVRPGVVPPTMTWHLRSGADIPCWSARGRHRSCAVLATLGPSIQWVQSFVTEDKITCVYIAPGAELVMRHARLGGFPADRILEVATVIDPTTESKDLAA